jgi:hypothetical protein
MRLPEGDSRQQLRIDAIMDGAAPPPMIGVHIDRKENEVDTADKLDAKLQVVRQKRWQGRDISFPVVLVPNKRVPFGKSIPGEALNELAATYGIDGYPTTVLIDKQGNVAGEFLGSVPEHREKLRRLIDAQ